MDNCQKIGDYFMCELKKLQQKYPIIKEVRGRGLMIAAVLNIDAAAIVNGCLEKGFLVNSTGGKILRFVPPLVITEKDVDQAVDILDQVLGDI